LFWSDMMADMDKRKDNQILPENINLIKLSKEVMLMAVNDPEMLNSIYRDISENLGMDIAMEIYRMFKGQQICFPMRFFNPQQIQKLVIQEYDGTNIKTLAIKYDYSEKTIRRIISHNATNQPTSTDT